MRPAKTGLSILLGLSLVVSAPALSAQESPAPEQARPRRTLPATHEATRSAMAATEIDADLSRRFLYAREIYADGYVSRALAVLVSEDGSVENRILVIPPDLPHSALVSAGNYLNARIRGRTLDQVRGEMEAGRRLVEAELDELTARLVEAGLASWAGLDGARRQLIVRGQGNLLEDLTAMEDLERIRLLFDDLETKTEVIDLLSRAENGEGVRIFIGSENKLFSLSGSSMIAAPFRDSDRRVVGVLGVIGPTRLNYARIVPMVDYTARVIARIVGGG